MNAHKNWKNFSESKCAHSLYVDNCGQLGQLCMSGCITRHIFTFAHMIYFSDNAKNNQATVRWPLHAAIYNGKIFFKLHLLYKYKPLVSASTKKV